MTLRRFYIPTVMIATERPEITGQEARHMCQVLRLTAGDTVELFDGSGTGYRARIDSATIGRVGFVIEASYPLAGESPVRITLAQGFLKTRKMDDLVRPLTELGICAWRPFLADRSVSRPTGRDLVKRLERWDKKALEAVKQCRRGRIPTIEPAGSLMEVFKTAAAYDFRIFFWEGEPLAVDLTVTARRAPRSILAVVGPEGGFTQDEVQSAKDHGFLICGLGPRILRAETAAVAALTLIQHRCGDMGIGSKR